MNINNINLVKNNTFRAIPVENLSLELERKRKQLIASNRTKRLDELDNTIKTIESLFPTISGSPIVVNIISKKKKNNKTNKTRKIVLYEISTPNKTTFNFTCPRGEDINQFSVKYSYLIDKLKYLEKVFKNW